MQIPIGRYAPNEYLTKFTFRCCVDRCGKSVEQTIHGRHMDVPRFPGFGWKQFNDDCWVCPDHKVSLVIDGVPCVDAFGYKFDSLESQPSFLLS